MNLAELQAALDNHFGGNAQNRRWRMTVNPVLRRGIISEFSDVAEVYEVNGIQINMSVGGSNVDEFTLFTNIIVLKAKDADNYFFQSGHGLDLPP